MWSDGTSRIAFLDPATVLPAIPLWQIKHIARLWYQHAETYRDEGNQVLAYGVRFSDWKHSFDLATPATWAPEATSLTPPLSSADYLDVVGDYFLPRVPNYGNLVMSGQTLIQWMSGPIWSMWPVWGPYDFLDPSGLAFTFQGELIRCYIAFAIGSLFQMLVARQILKMLTVYAYRTKTKAWPIHPRW
jgi:hypothetical protein